MAEKLVEAAEQVIADGNTPEHLLNNPVLLRQCAEKVTDNLIKNNVNVSSGENGLQRMENIVRLCCMANDRSTGAKVDYIIQEESAHSVKIPETKQKTQLDAVVEYLGKVAKSVDMTMNSFCGCLSFRKISIWKSFPDTARLHLTQVPGRHGRSGT